MRRLHRLVSMLALLLVACVDGATALQTSDGGLAACTASPTWHVSASGAYTYDSATDTSVGSITGTVRAVGSASFTVTTGEGDVDVVMQPPPPVGLGALQVGAVVDVSFDRGVAVDEYGTLVVALVAGTATGSDRPSIDVGSQPIHIETADALCATATPSSDAVPCLLATTQTRVMATYWSEDALLAPGEDAQLGRAAPYDVSIVASDRPATAAEALAVAPPGSPALCASGASSQIVAAIGAVPYADASPRCTTPVLRDATFAYVSGWRVHASGAFAYDTHVEPLVVSDVTATLTAVDTATSSITLASAAGDVELVLEPVQAAWLDALPIGHSVVAHFENGVTLRDAGDDALLLAVVAHAGDPQPIGFDVGSIHVAAAAVDCIQVRPSPPPCNPTGVWIRSQFDATFSLGTSSLTASVGDPPARLTDATGAFDVVLVASVGEGGFPADPLLSCDVGIQQGLFVAIGRVTP